MSSSRKQVALLIDPGDSWGRSVIRGICAEVRQRFSWDLLIAPRDDEWRFRVPRRWNGDGVIGAVRDTKSAAHVRALNVPVVNVSSWQGSGAGWHHVNTDDTVRAQMAFTHLRERNFSHFAYYGPPSQRYSDQRGICFQRAVSAAGFSCEMYSTRPSHRGWSSVKMQTLNWLERCPRPLAIFAADPHPAIQLAEICRGAGMRIPDEIAILSGDSDDLLCEVSDPPLSSIVLAAERIGEQSVQLLSHLMQNEPVTAISRMIPPVGIISRQSTDTLVVDDAEFVKALRYVRQKACDGIKVSDVVEMVACSRRLLEQKFEQYLGCSPAEEIRRVRLERVKELLVSTNLSLDRIAADTGYHSPSHLCVAFKVYAGETAGEFRQRFGSIDD